MDRSNILLRFQQHCILSDSFSRKVEGSNLPNVANHIGQFGQLESVLVFVDMYTKLKLTKTNCNMRNIVIHKTL